MSETLFALDRGNYRDCHRLYRGPRNEEYYLGDYSLESTTAIDVTADRKTAGSCSLIRIRSRNRQYFRRSWSHIRADGTDVAVLWFLKRGALSISHQSGRSLVKAGDFAVTYSTAPFYMECDTDEQSVHLVFHVVVPTHMLRRFIPAHVPAGFCTTAEGREFSLAERIFTDVFEDCGRLSEQSALRLVDGALSVLRDALGDRDLRRPIRRSLAETRLEQVLRFLDARFCDPALSLGGVAKACGISRRYLSFLLELHGTPFSTMIWQKRLNAAAEWLASADSAGVGIKEIAHRVGFKSPAHFSRLFKSAYDLSPTEYRMTRVGAADAH